MATLKTPDFKIEIEFKDVTQDLRDLVSSIRYTDNLSLADTIEITLENKNRIFMKEWFPSRGNFISLHIGYKNEKYLNCGTFRLNEIVFSGFPETVSLYGNSWISKGQIEFWKEKKTRTWENVSLSFVVNQIASEHNLQPFVRLKEDIEFKRLEQNNITTGQFLQNLSEKYGCTFKVYREKLVFVQWKYLDDLPPHMKITPYDVIKYRIKDVPREMYKKAIVQYWDPKTKELKEYVYEDPYLEYGGVLKVIDKAENLKQAMALAKHQLYVKNTSKVNPVLSLEGNPSLVAGTTVELDGFGVYDGKYAIVKAVHTFSPSSGYLTEVELKRCTVSLRN